MESIFESWLAGSHALYRFRVPFVEGGNQLIPPRKGIEKPDQMREQCFPRTQFTFMQEINDKHSEWVEAQRSEFLDESILQVAGLS
jgi:hypothetical protein